MYVVRVLVLVVRVDRASRQESLKVYQRKWSYTHIISNVRVENRRQEVWLLIFCINLEPLTSRYTDIFPAEEWSGSEAACFYLPLAS